MEHSGRTPGRAAVWLATAALVGLALAFAATGGHGGAAVRQGAAAAGVPADVASTPTDPPGTVPVPRRRHTAGHQDALGLDPGPGPLLGPGDDRDYATLMARVGPLVDTNETALFVMSEASAACQHPLDPGWRARIGRKRGANFLAWKERFCNGRVTMAEHEAAAGKLIEIFKRRYPGRDEEDMPSSGELLDAVLSSDDADVMFVADMSFNLARTTAWAPGADLVEGTEHAAKLYRYQQVAIEDMQCGVTGGCGPDGVRTAMICLLAAHYDCAPGQSAYDMWNDEFSPEEIGIIVAIEQRIRVERVRRAAARPD